jgi:hypothetical protein
MLRIKRLKCHQCGKRFFFYSSFVRHMFIHAAKEKRDILKELGLYDQEIGI